MSDTTTDAVSAPKQGQGVILGKVLAAYEAPASEGYLTDKEQQCFLAQWDEAYLVYCETIRVRLVAVAVHDTLDLPLSISEAIISNANAIPRSAHTCSCRGGSSILRKRTCSSPFLQHS